MLLHYNECWHDCYPSEKNTSILAISRFLLKKNKTNKKTTIVFFNSNQSSFHWLGSECQQHTISIFLHVQPSKGKLLLACEGNTITLVHLNKEWQVQANVTNLFLYWSMRLS